jgi:hypothetical protein
MSTKTTMALAAALILGTAPAALANDTDRNDTGGGPTQTWQDIEHARQDIQNQIQRLYHKGNAASAYGYVVSPTPKHHASHERTQDR